MIIKGGKLIMTGGRIACKWCGPCAYPQYLKRISNPRIVVSGLQDLEGKLDAKRGEPPTSSSTFCEIFIERRDRWFLSAGNGEYPYTLVDRFGNPVSPEEKEEALDADIDKCQNYYKYRYWKWKKFNDEVWFDTQTWQDQWSAECPDKDFYQSHDIYQSKIKVGVSGLLFYEGASTTLRSYTYPFMSARFSNPNDYFYEDDDYREEFIAGKDSSEVPEDGFGTFHNEIPFITCSDSFTDARKVIGGKDSFWRRDWKTTHYSYTGKITAYAGDWDQYIGQPFTYQIDMLLD